nr:MAG TPA: Stage V sporulation protein T, Activator, DNA-binding, Repressor, Sporulation [Caudoviricetes sp.]
MPRTTICDSGTTNLPPMETNDVIILNRPRQQKRGLSINVNGRITLRSAPCKLLGLRPGDFLSFVSRGSQTYIIKCGDIENAIRLSGRPGQLHGNSTATAKYLFMVIYNMPIAAKEVDLVVSRQVESIQIGDTSYPALAFINRCDKEHYR